MPCQYDPSQDEINQARAEATKKLVAPYIKKLDRLTRLLCEACTALDTVAGVQELSDDLNDWWEQHQAEDAKRNEDKAFDLFLKKLTPAERKMVEKRCTPPASSPKA